MRRFRRLRREFTGLVRRLAEFDAPALVSSAWARYLDELGRDLLPVPPVGFLRTPTLRRLMFTEGDRRRFDAERAALAAHEGPARLALLSREDPVGRPKKVGPTSANTIHHLHHLAAYETATGRRLRDARNVIEWGGGYGNLAKLFQRYTGTRVTYTIIDTPLMLAVQWLYLSSIHGRDGVMLMLASGAQPHDGAINLLPVGLAERATLSCELFISTWGISECPAGCQDLAAQDRWFGATGLLLAYQQSCAEHPSADRIGRLAADSGAKIVPIVTEPGNAYAFV